MSDERLNPPPDGAFNASELRQSVRHSLPPGVSASLRTHSGRLAYVTVTDLSRSGACVIRRGCIELERNENVTLTINDVELSQELCLPSQVQWYKEKNFNTEIGLRFLKGPLLPGSVLDQYLDQSLAIREGF